MPNYCGGYEPLMFLEAPPQHFLCPVCKLVIMNPFLMTFCGKTMCKVCIYTNTVYK